MFRDNFFVAQFGDSIIITLGMIEICSGLLSSRPTLQNLSVCLFRSDLKVPLIERKQNLTGFDQLIVIDVDALYCPCNARADFVHMRRGVGIICRYEVAGM